MSVFLPEGYGAAASLEPADEVERSQRDIALMQRVLSIAAKYPQQIPPDFLGLVADAIQVSNLLLPIGQIIGFTQFTAQAATPIATSETTTSTSYTDLATVGPTISNLPSGSYVVLFGCKTLISAAPNATFMAIQPNSTTPVDADSTGTSTTAGVAVARAVAITLIGASNTLTGKYRVDGGTGTFFRRWLIALKYANA